MDKLQAAWTAFPPDVASEYLKTFLHPSKESLEVLTDILQSYQGSEPLSLLDLGCGNAQMYEYFKEAGLRCRYVGVDLRGPLLDAAHRATQGDPNVSLIETDVNTLQGVGGSYDFAI